MKATTWFGLGLICRKIRRLGIRRSSLLALGALLGMLGVEPPAYRQSEFKPLSKTPSLGSIILFAAETARQDHEKEVVILLLEILSFLASNHCWFLPVVCYCA